MAASCIRLSSGSFTGAVLVPLSPPSSSKGGDASYPFNAPYSAGRACRSAKGFPGYSIPPRRPQMIASAKPTLDNVTPVPFLPERRNSSSSETSSPPSPTTPLNEAGTETSGVPTGIFGGLRRALFFQESLDRQLPTAASFAGTVESTTETCQGGSSSSLSGSPSGTRLPKSATYKPEPGRDDEVALGWAPFERQRFLAQHVLGAGGYGTVYLALDTLTDTRVALKVIPKRKRANPSARQLENTRTRLRSEAGLMQLMPEGSSCARLLDKFEDANNAYLVLEVVEGMTLDTFMDIENPPEEEMRGIFKQVFEFIADCHRVGIVFCDIKPANFMVQRLEDGIKVTAVDFGCAQLLQQGNSLFHRIGTFKYFAPEVYEQSYGTAADIWSAGIMMYRILAKSYPWWALREKLTPKEVQNFACSIHPAPFRHDEWLPWSSEARDLVSLLLNKDASTRCTASEALQHSWLSAEDSNDDGKKIVRASSFFSMMH